MNEEGRGDNILAFISREIQMTESLIPRNRPETMNHWIITHHMSLRTKMSEEAKVHSLAALYVFRQLQARKEHQY